MINLVSSAEWPLIERWLTLSSNPSCQKAHNTCVSHEDNAIKGLDLALNFFYLLFTARITVMKN